MSALKNPAYLLPALTLALFSLGYLYEYSYLDQFGVKEKIFLTDYSAFLIYSFHVLLFQFLDNPYIVVGAGFGASIIFLHRSAMKRKIKYRAFIESYVTKYFDSSILYTYAFLLSPIIFVILIFIPLHFGEKEAELKKSTLEDNWQVIVLKDGSELDGVTIREIKDTIIFLEKEDSVIHTYNKTEIKDIKYRSR